MPQPFKMKTNDRSDTREADPRAFAPDVLSLKEEDTDNSNHVGDSKPSPGTSEGGRDTRLVFEELCPDVSLPRDQHEGQDSAHIPDAGSDPHSQGSVQDADTRTVWGQHTGSGAGDAQRVAATFAEPSGDTIWTRYFSTGYNHSFPGYWFGYPGVSGWTEQDSLQWFAAGGFQGTSAFGNGNPGAFAGDSWQAGAGSLTAESDAIVIETSFVDTGKGGNE